MPDLSYRFKAEGTDDVRAQLRAVAAEAAAVQPPAFDTQAMTEALRAVVEELRGLSGAVDQTAAAFNARTAELGGSLERVAEGTGKVGQSLSTVATGTAEVGNSLTTVAGGITEMGEATGNLGRGVAALGHGVAEAGQAVLGIARSSVTFRDLEEDLRGVGQAAQPAAVEIQRLTEHFLLFQAAKRLLGIWVPPLALLTGISLITDAIDGAIAAYERLGEQQAGIQAALEKTGNAVGVTAAEIMDLALAQEQAGRYTQEGLAAAMGALAQYGTVSGDTYRTAAKLIDDLAARTGKDLPAAAKLLSTAMADPARAFGELAAEGIRFTAAERAAVLEMSRAGETAQAQSRLLALLANESRNYAEAQRDAARAAGEAGASFEAQAHVLTLLDGDLAGAGDETDKLALAQHQAGIEWRRLVEDIGGALYVFVDLKRYIGEVLELPAAAFFRGLAAEIRFFRGLFGNDDIGQEVVRLNKDLLDAQERQRRAQEDFDRDGRADQLDHLANVSQQVTSLERRIGELIAKGKQQVDESDRAEVESARTQLDTITAGITAKMDALPQTVAQRREAVNREIDAMVAKLSDLRQVQGTDTAQIDEQIVKLEILREARLKQVGSDEQVVETKAAATRATEEETSALAEYLRSLDESARLVGLDERERKIREATTRAQNLAIKEGNLLTQEEIDLIRQRVGARHDEEQADRKAEEARRAAVQEAERYARDIERTAESIGKDISEGLWDQITGEKRGADALEWFRRWLKRLGVEMLNTNLILPITTRIVGSMPSLFGVQPAGSGTGAGQPVTIGGQTYLPAGGGTGTTSLFGGGNGLGNIDQLASVWSPGTFAMPYDALPKNLVTGVDDVGQLGYTSTATSTLPFSAGQALTAAGSLFSAINAFQAFGSGRIGSGIGSTVSAGLGIASLAGVALGPLGPIGMIAAPILGGLLDGLFASKPSTKEGGSTINLETGADGVGGQTGKKFSAANRAEASKLSNAVYEMYERISDLAGGQRLTKDIFVGVGDRDGIRAQFDGPSNERFFTRDEAGVKELSGWFAGIFLRELKSGFEEPVQRAIENIDFTDLEEGLKKLDFAMGFGDTVKAMADNLGLEDAARTQAKASMKEMTGSLKEFLKTTDELWPGTTTGGTTRTETVREEVTLSAAEAIAQGLLVREQNYLGDATYETVWKDLDGRIVQVGEDLRETVTVWKDATRTITEGGTTVASAESDQARAGVRSLVDNMIAGRERDTYSEVEAAVAGINAAWDASVVTPMLELAGYAENEIPAKIEEGLRNNLDRLKEKVAEADRRLLRQLDGQGALNTIDDLIEARDAKLKDEAALGQGRGRADAIFDAQLQALFEGLDVDQLRAVVDDFTGAIADAANAVRTTALRDLDIQARTALRQAYDSGYRMSAEDSLRLLGLPLTEPQGITLAGTTFGSQDSVWLRRLRGVNAAADAGTLDEAAALAALDDLQAALDEGSISVAQYQGLLSLLTDAVTRSGEAATAAAAQIAAAEQARSDALADVARAVSASYTDLLRQAREEQRAAWQEELSRAQQARQAWAQVDVDAARTLRELRGDAAVSPLLAGQAYTEARERFEAAAMVPADGVMTPERASELLAAARPYLDAARGWLDEEAYYDIWTDVQSVLERTGAEAQRQTTAADDTVSRLESQIAWLQSLDGQAASQTRLLGEMRGLLAQGQDGYDALLALVSRMPGYSPYSAPADVQATWDAASADTRTGWARELGFTGDAGSTAFRDWLQGQGRTADFERLVRGGLTSSADPVSLYLAANPDVAADPYWASHAAEHYALAGAREGRARLGLTLTRDQEYLARYGDVAAAVLRGEYATGREHYDLYGQAEGRQYALGGLVTGGVWGTDSVPAWLMPGERVLSLDHARMFEQLFLMAEAANDDDRDASPSLALDRLHRPSPPLAGGSAAVSPAPPAGGAPPLAPLLDALARQAEAGEAAAGLAAEDRRRTLDRLEEVVRLLRRLDARAGRAELDAA